MASSDNGLQTFTVTDKYGFVITIVEAHSLAEAIAMAPMPNYDED